MIWVRHKDTGRELVYLHVPRTGGSSMIQSLREQPNLHVARKKLPHQTLRSLTRSVSARRLGKALVVAAIRDPYDWLVSQWCLVQHPRHSRPDGHMFHNHWPAFADYARQHCQHYGPWRFQSDFVTPPTAEFQYPQMFPFENLSDMWAVMDAHLGVTLERLHINKWNQSGLHTKRRRNGQSVDDFYTDQLRSFVRDRYACDFDAYEMARGMHARRKKEEGAE